MKKIPHNKPTLGLEESIGVNRVLRSGWIAEGPEVATFEQEFNSYLDLPQGHSAALASGTAALYLALLALGVKEGDEVIIPSYTCTPLLYAIALTRAKAVLVDIEPVSLGLSLVGTRKKINARTKAIILVHTFGQPTPVKPFAALGIPIIEDCAMALGATINGQAVGTLGTIGVFSFYASKTITTAYGGMLVSRQKKYVNWVKNYRTDDQRRTYEPRFNFHLSDLQAALGRVQLKKLPAFLSKRRQTASLYHAVLPLEAGWPKNSDKLEPNFHRFLLRTTKPKKCQAYLKSNGIETIIPIQSWELLHHYLQLDKRSFPESEQATKTTLSIPIYPSLTKKEINWISRTLANLQDTI